ncbi:MAG: hypothetical protein QOI58_2994 [Thermoanaerobaculia bacterium]|jgi:hypothetical protein|nr:hypothetical protein [Thermoanaerobaculia bacterium]
MTKAGQPGASNRPRLKTDDSFLKFPDPDLGLSASGHRRRYTSIGILLKISSLNETGTATLEGTKL